jgi:hypothetical protein
MFMVLAGTLTWHGMARAQTAAVPPPALAACQPATPPDIPVRWRAATVMMPLLEGQIDVGDFVYDGTLPAMRATVYGLQSGTVDLLITGEETYRLDGPRGAPVACTSLGRKFSLPAAQWLSAQAVCTGETHLGATRVQAWKMPGNGGQTVWHWFGGANRLPVRSMFVSRTAGMPVIGDYAMTYFVNFAAVAQTGLAPLRDFCRANAKPGPLDQANPAARDLMAVRNEKLDAEREAQIRTIVPGVTAGACSRMTPVQWPEQFVASAVITPNSFDDNPYAGLVYYDWKDVGAQFAILWQGVPAAFRGVVALKKGVGFQPGRNAAGQFRCPAIYPGMVRPDWAKVAACQCKGVIEGNPALSPHAVTQIFSCPIKAQPGRIMWNMYSSEGRPLVFAEASARGVGAMLADYHEWRPGHKVPASDFALPAECRPDDTPPPGSDSSNVSCSECHTTR